VTGDCDTIYKIKKDKNFKMRKKIIVYIIFVMLSLLAFLYSCEKKEPKAQPDPSEITGKITEQFPGYEEMPEPDFTKLYSENKNEPVDLSKIEKYSIIQGGENSAVEIAVFKLYDKTNAEYVKQMAQARISELQGREDLNADIMAVYNNAEIRSYGNYVYYVSHTQKDKIFEIIEDNLRGE